MRSEFLPRAADQVAFSASPTVLDRARSSVRLIPVARPPADFRNQSTRGVDRIVEANAPIVGAGRGNRTPTGLLAPADFKSAASANFAIPAPGFILA
jgi:hypothetical protein